MNLASVSRLSAALKLVCIFTHGFSFLFFLSLLFAPLQAQTLVFSEDFETWAGSPASVAGWTAATQATCNSGASCYWGRNDVFGPLNQPAFSGCDSMGFYARCNTENLIYGDLPALISPILDLSGYPLTDSMKLSFCYINSSLFPIDGDGIIVSFSANGGASWPIQFLDINTVHNIWTTIELEIPATFKGPVFRLKIEGVGNGSSGDIGIDELTILNEPLSCTSFSAAAIASSDYNGTAISCFGASDGAAKGIPIGGQAPYSFLWNDGQTGMEATGLPAGMANITITDANNCQASASISLTEPEALQVEIVKPTLSEGFDIACYGDSTGSATAIVSGGTSPYHYYWSQGQTLATANQLSAGAHTLTVTDQNGCVQAATTLISGPEPMQMTLTPSPASCADKSDGSIDLALVGGRPPYTYHWSDGSTQADLNFASAGSYKVQATDAKGCRVSAAATIDAPPALLAEALITQPACFGEESGFVALSVSGGQSPYAFTWSNGATSQDLFDLGAGRYTVAIVDAAGCARNLIVDLEAPEALSLQILATPDNGTSIGTILVNVSGGQAPYQYAWDHSPHEFRAEVDSLPIGTYRVTVTDASGCEIKQTIAVEAVQKLDCLQIHTGFTPNGDGVNELWRIPCLPYFADNELTILNRWGQHLLQVDNYQNDWDGTANGVPLPDGTYYYILKLNSPTDKRVFRGTVSILR